MEWHRAATAREGEEGGPVVATTAAGIAAHAEETRLQEEACKPAPMPLRRGLRPSQAPCVPEPSKFPEARPEARLERLPEAIPPAEDVWLETPAPPVTGLIAWGR